SGAKGQMTAQSLIACEGAIRQESCSAATHATPVCWAPRSVYFVSITTNDRIADDRTVNQLGLPTSDENSSAIHRPTLASPWKSISPTQASTGRVSGDRAARQLDAA